VVHKETEASLVLTANGSNVETRLTQLADEAKNMFKEGANITITDNSDGTKTISSTGGGGGDLFIVVSVLPSTGIENKLYLVPASQQVNSFVIWAWINNAWASMGNLQIDLSNYYTITQVNALINSRVNVAGGSMTGALVAMPSPTPTVAQMRNITISTTDLVPNVSTLASGTVYIVVSN
jgi:hypothetical protein